MPSVCVLRDIIENWAVLKATSHYYRYIEVLKCLYEALTMTVQVQKTERKTNQTTSRLKSDIISPKLFTNMLKDVLKTRDINIHGQYISYLRFADDIVIIAEFLQGLDEMPYNLSHASRLITRWFRDEFQ